jgi:hypothetical protein
MHGAAGLIRNAFFSDRRPDDRREPVKQRKVCSDFHATMELMPCEQEVCGRRLAFKE